jgi:hypothetical protein
VPRRPSMRYHPRFSHGSAIVPDALNQPFGSNAVSCRDCNRKIPNTQY